MDWLATREHREMITRLFEERARVEQSARPRTPIVEVVDSKSFAQLAWSALILEYESEWESNSGNIMPATQPALIETFAASTVASQQTHTDLEFASKRNSDQQIENIKSRFLDVVAEFISHTSGWHYVTVTALRETDSEVLVDVVTNGGFDFTKELWDNSAQTRDALLLRGIESMVSRYEMDSLTGFGKLKYACTVQLLPNLKSWIQELVGMLDRVQSSVFEKMVSFDDGAYLLMYLQPDRDWSFSPAIHDVITRNGAHRLSRARSNGRLIRNFIQLDLPPLYYHEDPNLNRLTNTMAVNTFVSAVGSFLFNESRGIFESYKGRDGRRVMELLHQVVRPETAAYVIKNMIESVLNRRHLKIVPHYPPAKVRLDPKYHVPLSRAWSSLELPDTPETKLFVNRHEKQFAERVSTPLNIHTEVQMLTVYALNPDFHPSLNYFGCSKRACLLCDAMTKLAPEQIKMRGTHGKCYSLWGIPVLLQERNESEVAQLITTRIRGIVGNPGRYLSTPESDLDVRRS